MAKNKIFIKHWLDLKPYKNHNQVDIYYLKIANSINSNLDLGVRILLRRFLNEEDILMFCCFLGCYFEDVISETNIWNTFRQEHENLYGKKLPFYDLSQDYTVDEVNFEDTLFLAWYFVNALQEGSFISPYNPFLAEIANDVMEIFDEEYEYAPENTTLKSLIGFKSKNTEFYHSREYLQLIFFDSYLFYPDIKSRMNYEIQEIIEENEEKDPHRVMGYIRGITEYFTFNAKSALLAYSAKDWASAILGKSHLFYKSLQSVSEKIEGFFLFKGLLPDAVLLEHIASGEKFEMTKKSFDHTDQLKDDDIVFIGLVKWNEEWWFSGNFVRQDFDADLILDQRNSADARAQVKSLYDTSQIEDILRLQETAFLRYNNGSHLAFIDSSKINDFLSNFIKFFNDSLDLSEKEIAGAHKRTKSDGYLKEPEEIGKFNDIPGEAGIVFFNKAVGPELYYGVLNAFPDKNNPFFKAEDKDDVLQILFSPDFSKEFTIYFIDQYKDSLKIFADEPYKSYLDNLDFLLRFFKTDSYHSNPSVVLTGS